jgi:hypothetical protein
MSRENSFKEPPPKPAPVKKESVKSIKSIKREETQKSHGGGHVTGRSERSIKAPTKPAKRNDSRSDSVTKMIEVNDRLKNELFEVVDKMNNQLDRF